MIDFESKKGEGIIIEPKQKKRSPKKKQMPLDEKYLGHKLPGTELQRQMLLDTLKELLEEEGEDWVRKNRQRLLDEAESIVNSGISL